MKKYKLANICEFNKSYLCNKTHNGDFITYLDTGNITNNRIDTITTYKLEDAPLRAKRLVKKDTIIYSSVRPNLKHYGIIEENNTHLIVSTGFITIDIKEKYKNIINPYYLYLLLTQPCIISYVHSVANNLVSSYPSITYSDIAKLEFNFPSYETQSKIISVIYNIDKIINNKQEIINKLQELSETIYNYWFVQFDFPDEKGRPYKTSGGKMEWNEELGKEIPKDWKVENLCKYNKFYNGYAFKSDTYLPYGKYKLYTIKNIKTNGIDNKICDYIDELPNKMEHNCLLDVGDIVLTLTGHVGRIGIVYEKNALLNQRLLKIKTEYPLFMYLLFKNSEINKQIIKQANGTSQKNLSPLSLANIYYACPNLELLLLFSQKYGYIYNMMTNLMQEIQELNSLRDFLLPLLMNGQVGFKESED